MLMLFYQIINSLGESVRYALFAVGFTLFFGVLDVIVFCVGDICVVSMFILLSLFSLVKVIGLYEFLPIYLCLIITVVIGSLLTGFFGIIIEGISVKPFEKLTTKTNPMMPLIATVALGIIIRQSISLFYPQGRYPQNFPNFFPAKIVKLGSSFHIIFSDLIVLLIGIGVIIVVFFLVNRTKFGSSMRAIAQDKEAAMMMGINADRISVLTFFLVGLIMGIAGFLTGTYIGSVKFDMGLRDGIIGFSAAVVGGLGNVYGAIIGGLLFGIIESLSIAFIPMGGAYKDIFCFTAVIISMIFRPKGILGEKTIWEKV